MFKKLLLPSLIGAVLFPTVALADDSEEAQRNLEREGFFYLGARAGMSTFNDLCGEDSKDCEDQDVGYSAYAGYQFKEWLALEVTAGSYGSPDIERASTTAPDQTVRTTGEVLGAEVTAKLTAVEVGDDLDVYARFGGAYQQVTSSSADHGDVDYDRTGAVSAIGVEYDLTDQLSVRAEYEYLYFLGDNNKVFEDSNMQFASVGLNYKFRDSTPVELPITQAPVETPPPPPPPEPVFITVSDSQGVPAIFDFDSAKLNDVSRLRSAIAPLFNSKGAITVRAYTDSIGADAYNLKLSERRAQAAINYLISQGIDASRLRGVGMGEANPIAPNTTREGRAQNRRVEFEYSVERQQ